jgi:hypothetical protein
MSGGDEPIEAPRDRDDDGRARSARPRDQLGRPLAPGSPGVEREPEGVHRSPRESLQRAQELLDQDRPFQAHEVLEDAWKQAPPAERELWRGLAQLAVGLTHLERGNQRGALALLTRGRGSIAPYLAAAPHDLDVSGLLRWADDQISAASTGPTPPPRLFRGRPPGM